MWFWYNCSMQVCNMILLLQTCLCQGEMIKEIFLSISLNMEEKCINFFSVLQDYQPVF